MSLIFKSTTAPRAVVLFLFLLISSCTEKDIPKTAQYFEDFEKSNALKASGLAFWGNIHGLLKECGCDFTPFGGFKRRERALKDLKSAPFTKDFLYVDHGNLLNPSTESLTKSRVAEILKRISSQAQYFHLSLEDQKTVDKFKLKIPQNALLANQHKSFTDKNGTTFILFTSSEGARITAEGVNKELSKLSNLKRALPVILNTEKIGTLDFLSSELSHPFLVLGIYDKLQGPLCFEKKKGLYCFGIWDGKYINMLRLYPPPNNDIAKVTHWVSLPELYIKADRYEDSVSQGAKPKIIEGHKEDFMKHLGEYENAWLYDKTSIILDEKSFGSNE